jgi:hypothetical protein
MDIERIYTQYEKGVITLEERDLLLKHNPVPSGARKVVDNWRGKLDVSPEQVPDHLLFCLIQRSVKQPTKDQEKFIRSELGLEG